MEGFEVARGRVAKDWIDRDIHMNVARKQGPLPRPMQAYRRIGIKNPLYLTE